MEVFSTTRDLCERLGKNPEAVRALCEEVVKLRLLQSDLASLDAQRRRVILCELNQSKSIAEAARRLDLNRTTLSDWMRRNGVHHVCGVYQ